jgi:RNA polymerase sigma-70 factor, ECF subfamily
MSPPAAFGRTASLDVDHTFTAAVRPHVQRLYAVAYSILRDNNEADDAVQATMVLAWRHWESLKDRDNPGPWLAKICVNHCLRHRKLLVSRWRTMDADVEATDVAHRTAVPFAGRMLDLDTAYRRLSLQQRAVVALTYHHGYTVVEAASLKGCRPGTARSHLARALATLRKELRDD